MRDCKIRCIDYSQSFRKGYIYYVVDSYGEYMFTIKQNLPLGDKQYILKEEINKYESANR